MTAPLMFDTCGCVYKGDIRVKTCKGHREGWNE
jgi:hypothetical protein